MESEFTSTAWSRCETLCMLVMKNSGDLLLWLNPQQAREQRKPAETWRGWNMTVNLCESTAGFSVWRLSNEGRHMLRGERSSQEGPAPSLWKQETLQVSGLEKSWQSRSLFIYFFPLNTYISQSHKQLPSAPFWPAPNVPQQLFQAPHSPLCPCHFGQDGSLFSRLKVNETCFVVIDLSWWCVCAQNIFFYHIGSKCKNCQISHFATKWFF